MTIVALDFGTANARRSSARALGIVVFDRTRIRYEWSTLLNPGQHVTAENSFTNDIGSAHMAAAPTARQLARTLWRIFDGATFVSHTCFDASVIEAISCDAGIAPPDVTWLDSCFIARRLWSHLPNHKLKTVCDHLNFKFQHHDPLEDARACSHIVRVAMQINGWDAAMLRKIFGRSIRPKRAVAA